MIFQSIDDKSYVKLCYQSIYVTVWIINDVIKGRFTKRDCSNGIQKGRINQLLNIKGELNTKKRSGFGNPFFVHSSFIDDQNPEKHTLL